MKKVTSLKNIKFPRIFRSVNVAKMHKTVTGGVLLKIFTKFTGKHVNQSLWVWNFIEKRTLSQVFSCEFAKLLRMHFCRRPLGHCFTQYHTSTAELFYNNSQRVLVFGQFHREAPSWMFNRVLNTPLDQLFHDGGPYHIEASPAICSTNQ